ncbi:MAG: GAP family protein [Oscillatoriales cyanobacterium C42_A2020_001]|nr:GAP family protein [Leptolyngbyaceae cyanobacterium C42_A2020_001]
MEILLVSLLPYIIGSAVVPLQIIIGLLLLTSPQQGLLKAIAYVGGMTLTRILQGVVFGLILAEAIATAEEGSGKGPVISTLLLVLGILLLIAAYKKWSGEDDPDAPPPKWFTRIDRATPLQAFGFGFAFPLISAKLWVFTLSALTTIAAAELGQSSSAIAYLLFIVLAQSLLLLPIVTCIVLPTRSQTVLNHLADWMTRNSRPIGIGVSLIFGLWFLYSGIKGFLK